MKDVPGELHLAGKGVEVHIDEQDASGLHVHGFVEDIDGFVNDHGILVSPIRIGSGIRVKILESMALGKPIITTAIGAAGIEYEKSKCLTIAESREDFIQAMTELSSNAHLREEIGRNAHSYIRKNHNIEEISKQLLELLQS